MTTDRLHASRRRAVLAVAGLLAAAEPARAADLALGPWYLRVGGRFAGPVARVVSRDHPLGECTLELGAATAAAMSGMIDSALAGAGASEDITLFRGGTRGILGLELSGARVTAVTVPQLDAADLGEPVVRVRIAWKGRSVSRLPDSFVVAAPPPAAADPAPLAVRIDGQPVRAASVGSWTAGGDLTLTLGEAPAGGDPGGDGGGRPLSAELLRGRPVRATVRRRCRRHVPRPARRPAGHSGVT
jgi:hypothetical protein